MCAASHVHVPASQTEFNAVSVSIGYNATARRCQSIRPRHASSNPSPPMETAIVSALESAASWSLSAVERSGAS